jgi:hypothetical protein
MKQLNYKEQLQLARNSGIDPIELYIAEEVDAMSVYSTNEEFETVCALVCDTYMDTTNDCIYYCAKAIVHLFSKYNAKELWEMSAWERLDLYEEEF